MSTRSMIGIGHLEDFQARYVHSDGYPEGVGNDLFEIVRERGLVEAMQVLMEHEWSYLVSDAQKLNNRERMPEYYPPPEAYDGLPGKCYCHLFTDHGSDGGSYGRCPSWGKGYSTLKSPHCDCEPRNEPLRDPMGPPALKDTWCEWMYLLGEDQVLRVYKLGYVSDDIESKDFSKYAWHVSDVDLKPDAPAPDWAAINRIAYPEED